MFFGPRARTVDNVTAPAAAPAPPMPRPAALRGCTPFPRVLLESDGTVTHLLEAWTGEPVEAVKLHQAFSRALRSGSALDIAKGTPVLRRQVLLRGTLSNDVLLHATASIAVHRLPRPVLDGLLMTCEPIGRLLVASRVETFREVLYAGVEPAGACSLHFGLGPDDELLFRTYRVLRGGRPMMVITERLPMDSRPVSEDAQR